MATIKSYTDLSQAKKLAEILPLESADMYYTPPLIKGHTCYFPHLKRKFPIDWDIEQAIPCWSLAALLGVLPEPELTQSSDRRWMLRIWDKKRLPWTIGGHVDPVEACYEMILKLNELKML